LAAIVMKNVIPFLLPILLLSCNSFDASSRKYSGKDNLIVTECIIDDSIINSKDVQKIIEPVWWTGDIYNSHEDYLRSLKLFSQNQKYVYAIQWYQAEVDNGGHEQFFYNSTGIVWEDALNGFKKIGLFKYYKILGEAIAKMDNDIPFDREMRIKTLQSLNPDFDSLDVLFYKTDSIQPLQEALFEFIDNNRRDFYFHGKIERPINSN
jgi:Domain of unknown function (DUF4375)